MNFTRSRVASMVEQAWGLLLPSGWLKNRAGDSGWSPNRERVLPFILPSPSLRRTKMENSTVHREVKGKILIVDDSPDTLEIVQKLLHYEGFDVVIASTGEEGVKKVEEEKPDVVLMDINLPGIDGTEALRRIRIINPLQCVSMLTAFATVENAIRALKEGAFDFVKKPFENEHLIHIVNQSLEKYKTLKEKEKLEEEVRRLSITDDFTGLYTVDSGYRYGGDEFAVLLIGASVDHALTIAERIRSSIEQAEFKNITVSIGLTEYRDHFALEEFVKSADDAMYIAKHSGGNRVHTNIPAPLMITRMAHSEEEVE